MTYNVKGETELGNAALSFKCNVITGSTKEI